MVPTSKVILYWDGGAHSAGGPISLLHSHYEVKLIVTNSMLHVQGQQFVCTSLDNHIKRVIMVHG
jgi:hypothetical protein